MTSFFNAPGVTTVDDMIEKVMSDAVANGRAGASLLHYCSTQSGTDFEMIRLVLDKMVQHGFAEDNSNPKTIKNEIIITSSGRDLYTKYGGWKEYLEGLELKQEKEDREKEEDRELNRRSADAVERAAESAEKSAKWTKIACIVAALAVGISIVALFKPDNNEQEIRELQESVEMQQNELRELRDIRVEVDSLRVVVKAFGEIKQQPTPGKQR